MTTVRVRCNECRAQRSIGPGEIPPGDFPMCTACGLPMTVERAEPGWRALSIRQPWPWAIFEAGKPVENRSWNTFYRGPILLHASRDKRDQRLDAAEISHAIAWMIDRGLLAPGCLWPGLANVPRGGIVGQARLVDVVRPGDRAHQERLESRGVDMRWWVPACFGFVLADVKPLPFVAWPGALNLFAVPDDYASRPAPTGRLAHNLAAPKGDRHP